MRTKEWLALAGFGVALFAGHLLYKGRAYAALTPRANTLGALGGCKGAGQELLAIDHVGGRSLVCRGPRAGLLAFPSGPAVYVFDEHGVLVDWTPDVGDTPRLSWAQTGGTPR